MKVNVVKVFVNAKGQCGNLLGIVVDENKKLTKTQRQKIAAKLNYSETVFVNDLTNPDVSIFNPTDDMDFSGYAVLGAAYFLKHKLGLKFLSIKCGDRNVKVSESGKLTFIEAPLSIMPPWNFKQLATAEAVDKLTKESFAKQKHLVVWAWIDQDRGLFTNKFGPISKTCCRSSGPASRGLRFFARAIYSPFRRVS